MSGIQRSVQVIAAVAALALPIQALAAAKTRHAAPAAPATIRDPAALAALDSLGQTLRGLKAFSFTAETTGQTVTADGQRLDYTGTALEVVRYPDRLRLEIANEAQTRTFYYDGKTFTIFAPKLNYYTQVSAPATIAALDDTARQKYGVHLPLSEIFRWGTSAIDNARVLGAMKGDVATIGGRTCDHYAFREKGRDWQLWIDRAPPGLICKIVNIDTSGPVDIRSSAVLTWNTDAKPADSDFVFVAPAGAGRIPIATVEKAVAAKTSKGKK